VTRSALLASYFAACADESAARATAADLDEELLFTAMTAEASNPTGYADTLMAIGHAEHLALCAGAEVARLGALLGIPSRGDLCRGERGLVLVLDVVVSLARPDTSHVKVTAARQQDGRARISYPLDDFLARYWLVARAGARA
jgi:hypothetical protein